MKPAAKVMNVHLELKSSRRIVFVSKAKQFRVQCPPSKWSRAVRPSHLWVSTVTNLEILEFAGI